MAPVSLPASLGDTGSKQVQTLWGELAWQLGGEEAFALVKTADANGTSPGKDLLKTLLEKHAPCVVLIDELVAYVRQFPESQALSGGSYDTNLSFVQALTEAAKLVPNAILLASLPESESRGREPARGGHASGRWRRPLAGCRRCGNRWRPRKPLRLCGGVLFEPIKDAAGRESGVPGVCRHLCQLRA
jgi:predicted AAA+ superfamily ATPase